MQISDLIWLCIHEIMRAVVPRKISVYPEFSPGRGALQMPSLTKELWPVSIYWEREMTLFCFHCSFVLFPSVWPLEDFVCLSR